MALIMKKKEKNNKTLIIPKAGSGTHSSKSPAAPHQSLDLGAVANSLLVSKAVVFKGTKARSPQLEKNPACFPRAPPVTSRRTKSKFIREGPHGNHVFYLS